jgi:hypothetical protein
VLGNHEVAEVAILPPDPNPTGGAWIVDRSPDFQSSRPMLDVDEFDRRLRTRRGPPRTTRSAEITPAAQKTILVDRVRIRKHVALDQDIGGVEGIDQRSSRLFPCTAA